MAGQKLPEQESLNALGVFHEGLAVVQVQGEWFHILQSGEPAYPERYERAEYFQNGAAWVKVKGGGWKRIDKHGKEIKNE